MEATMQLQPLRLGGVLDGKAEALPCWLQEHGHIFNGLWDRCCSAACVWLSKVAELCWVHVGRSAQGRYKQAAPFNVDRCNHATGRVGIILPMYGCAGKHSGSDSIGRLRGHTSEAGCFWKNRLTLHRAILLWDAVRVASRGGTPDEQTCRVSAVGEDVRAAGVTRLQEWNGFNKYVGEVRTANDDGSTLERHVCGRAKSAMLLGAAIKVLASKLNMELFHILWGARRPSGCIVSGDFSRGASLQYEWYRHTGLLENDADVCVDDIVPVLTGTPSGRCY